MKKILVALIGLWFLSAFAAGFHDWITGAQPKAQPQPPPPTKVAEPKPKVEQPPKQLTDWEIITMPNHPRLASPVVEVREFYKGLSSKVALVEGNDDAPWSILLFKKECSDAQVGHYEQKDVGEVDKIICNVTKTGKQMTFEEIKPVLLTYFPVEMVRENFRYEKGVRFHNSAGSVIYAWQYASNGENLYHGKPPYGGNLTVIVQEIKGAVAAFGMFYGQKQRVPFMTSAVGYEVENFDVDFSY